MDEGQRPSRCWSTVTVTSALVTRVFVGPIQAQGGLRSYT